MWLLSAGESTFYFISGCRFLFVFAAFFGLLACCLCQNEKRDTNDYGSAEVFFLFSFGPDVVGKKKKKKKWINNNNDVEKTTTCLSPLESSNLTCLLMFCSDSSDLWEVFKCLSG